RARRLHGALVDRPARAGEARARERAVAAQRGRARQADERAELDQRLVVRPGAALGEQLLGRGDDPLPPGAATRIDVEVDEARKDALDVPVDARRLHIERERGDRARGVRPDPGQCTERLDVARKYTTVVLYDLLRRRVEVSRPAVVAEPRPEREDV